MKGVSKEMSEVKTNVLRILDKAKIPYTYKTYTVEDGKIDGLSVAKKVGKTKVEVFKTLLVQGKTGVCYVCVIPVYLELDLKKVSKVCGEKKIEMLPVGDLLGTTGYIRGGCSPIGMKKLFKTFIHETAKSLETLTISAGKIGVQVTLAPDQLSTLVKARYADLAGEV